jgi:hypothetical protein
MFEEFQVLAIESRGKARDESLRSDQDSRNVKQRNSLFRSCQRFRAKLRSRGDAQHFFGTKVVGLISGAKVSDYRGHEL